MRTAQRLDFGRPVTRGAITTSTRVRTVGAVDMELLFLVFNETLGLDSAVPEAITTRSTPP